MWISSPRKSRRECRPLGRDQARERICEAVRLAAFLHGAFWNSDETAHAFIKPIRIETSWEAQAASLEQWANLLRAWTPSTRPAFLVDEREFRRLLVQADAQYSAAVAGFPGTLCHGDFHLGNLLLDAGGLVLADWQEVSKGAGPEDVAFLLLRAEASGVPIDYDTVVPHYVAVLASQTHQPIDLGAVENITAATQLASILLEWPYYLTESSRDVILRLCARAEWCCDILEIY